MTSEATLLLPTWFHFWQPVAIDLNPWRQRGTILPNPMRQRGTTIDYHGNFDPSLMCRVRKTLQFNRLPGITQRPRNTMI